LIATGYGEKANYGNGAISIRSKYLDKHEEPKMKKPLFESEEEIRQFFKDCFVYSADNNIGASDNSIISENKTVEMAKARGYIKKSIVEEAEDAYQEIVKHGNHLSNLEQVQYDAIQHLKQQLSEAGK